MLTTEKQQDPSVSLKLTLDGFNTIEVPQSQLFNRAKSSYTTGKPQNRHKKILSTFFNYARNRLGIFNACRMPDFADLWIKPARKAIENEKSFDVVISTAGPYSVHLLAYFLKKRGQAKRWIADYRDTWSDNYFYPGIFPINLIEKLLERKILRSADTITTVSSPFTESFRKKYKKESVVTIPNGFDPDDLKHIDPTSSFPDDHKLRIVHTGSIYLERRDPSPLFQAIADLQHSHQNLLDSLEVIFVGANQANLQSLVEKYQVEKWVKLQGFVAREQALAMQRDANALLFLPWNDPKVDGIVTGKIFEYLYAKTPIIAVGASHMEQSQQMILDAKAGQTFHSVEAIKSYLVTTLQERDKRDLPCDQDFLKQYDRKAIAQHFLEVIKR